MRVPVITAMLVLAWSLPVFAAGTPAGTVIDNVAQIEFDVNGSRITVNSNPVTVTVIERIDLVLTVSTPQLLVGSGETNRGLLFTITNTGNGSETFSLSADSNVGGGDFNPTLAVPPIYFDSDGSGDYSIGDVAYAPGSNDPQLDADESVNMLLVNDIPGTAIDGQRGFSQLTVTSLTGSGAPGALFPGQGDGGVNAIAGSSGASAQSTGEYFVADVEVDVSKAVSVADPFGGTQPVPGATLTYTISVQVTAGGPAVNSVFTDPIPTNTTYQPSSLALNGTPLSDAADADAGEYDALADAVVVRLGDLAVASGVQTVTFDVTID